MADHRYLSGNALVCGDNLHALRELPDECVDLIYLDPPFNSNQFYVAAFGKLPHGLYYRLCAEPLRPEGMGRCNTQTGPGANSQGSRSPR